MAEEAPSILELPRPLPRELELKLVGPMDVLERAFRSPLLKNPTQARAVTRYLHSVYFDTPDSLLQRKGIGLRLRKQGRKWIQTVKQERRVAAGMHDRDEFEATLTARWPSFAVLVGTAFEEAFQDLDLRKLIQPVFATEFRRSFRLLEGEDSALVEVAFDRGKILAEQREEPIGEIELELKRGGASALFTLARQLCSAFPLRLESRSKAERGYALVQGAAHQPRRARSVVLHERLSVSEAFVTIASECLCHLQGNEEGLIEGANPEFLHQARVALRRLRAAIRLFRPATSMEFLAPQNIALRDLNRALGEARDWDVFELETLPALAADLLPEASIGLLADAVASKRKNADLIAIERVKDRVYTRTLLDFAASLYQEPWLTTQAPEVVGARAMPLQEFALRVLAKRWQTAIKRSARIDVDRPASLHPLRIELKKLRYGGEFFATLFPKKPTKKFLSLLSDVQDHLGHINDAASVARMSDALRAELQQPEAREALGALRGYFAAKARSEAAPTLKAWKRLKRAQRFWE